MTQKIDRQYDDEVKSNKRLKHARNQKGKGMKVLNSYVEEDYDDYSYDEIDIYDEDDNTNT